MHVAPHASTAAAAPPHEPAPARSVNPAAGDHVVAGDPVELAAARRAAGLTWKRFPYYAHRFGARGQRFAHSDSGWLVTLVDLPPAAALGQVRWLGGVLAARGMPRWMLEAHLGVLAAELARARPDRQSRYALLGEAATALRAERLAAIPADRFDALDTGFAGRVGSPWRERFPHTGGLVAAAVADEHTGVRGAVASLTGWLLDPARFPAAWVLAVEVTLAEARDATRWRER